MSQWFREDLRGTAADVLLDADDAAGAASSGPRAVERLLDDHTSGRADHGERIWSLFMLELWQRRYLDESGAPDSSPS